MPIILVSVNDLQESFIDWDEDMQLECANSFKRIDMTVSSDDIVDEQ